MHDPKIQFGCGLLFGGMLGLDLARWILDISAGLVLGAIALSGALILGWLCAKNGDPVWNKVGDWIQDP